ncbi:MAG TPA: hypothetical protein P5150_01165, partial [Candidatus Ratteibacteria bacterium]|nr:hypothetical protein [Candidatus Ratteibacteria bacterium]
MQYYRAYRQEDHPNNWPMFGWPINGVFGGIYSPLASPELCGMCIPYRVLGLDFAGMSTYSGDYESITNITLIIEDTGNPDFDPTTDLAYDESSPLPNISIWRDANNDGYFDPSVDTLVAITNNKPSSRHAYITPIGKTRGQSEEREEYRKWKVVLKNGASSKNSRWYLEDEADGVVDYFVVIATEPSSATSTNRPKYGADFKVYIDPNDSDLEESDGSKGVVVSRDWLLTGYSASNNPDSASNNPDIEILPTKNSERNADNVKDVKFVLDIKPSPIQEPLEADGVPIPVFHINTTDSWGSFATNEKIEWIRVWFLQRPDNLFTPNWLSSLSSGEDSGVSLWIDNKSAGKVGVFDNKLISEGDMESGTQRLSIYDTCVP